MQAHRDGLIKGIDVSRHQESIDWMAMKAAGVAFVYIKATEGVTYQDPKYKEHYAGAKRAGLKIGFYHYARPYNDPRKEVANLLEKTKYLHRDLPYALDIETDEDKFGRTHISDFSVLWLEELERLGGGKPIVYTYTHFAKTCLDQRLAAWPVWIAHYNTKQPGANGIWDNWVAHQYTSDNDGLPYPGRLDVNVAEPKFIYGEEKTVEKKEFADVPDTHWARADIAEAAEDGLLVGYPDETFRPNDPVTRAQLAVVIARVRKLEGKVK